MAEENSYYKILKDNGFVNRVFSDTGAKTGTWDYKKADGELSVTETLTTFYLQYDPSILLGAGNVDKVTLTLNKAELTEDKFKRAVSNFRMWCDSVHQKIDAAYNQVQNMNDWLEWRKKYDA